MSSVHPEKLFLLLSMCDLNDFKSLFLAERIVLVINSDAESCEDPSPVSASVSSDVLKASVPT